MLFTEAIVRKTIFTLGLFCVIFISKNSNAQYVSDYIYPDSVFVNAHSPNKATFYSAIVPGLGQIYNQKYWKVPIIYAGLGGLIYYANYNNYVYNKYKDAYNVQLRIEAGESELDPLIPGASKESLKRTKDTWKRYRNLTIIGIGFLYVAQIIDADVDAHLFDYDMSEDLSMQLQPCFMPIDEFDLEPSTSTAFGLRCSIRF